MDDISAKIIALVALIALTIIFGCLPYFLVLRGSHSCFSNRFREEALACLNCFAGGVFLGTLLLHLMPEGAEDFDGYKESIKWETDFPFFNLFIFGGLFLIALVEHFIHACLHHHHSHEFDMNNQSHVDSSSRENEAIQSNKYQSNYGTVSTVELNGGTTFVDKESEDSLLPDGAQVFIQRPAGACPPGPHCDPSDTLQGPENLHHQAHGFQAFLLLIALSFHTIFDGLAVGLQKSGSEVWSVFTAIALHKSIIAFCLGYEMFKKYVNHPWRSFLWMCMFAIMAPFGIALGIGLEEGNIDSTAKSLASSVLQGIAAGVFLYVTFLEILCSYMGHGCVRGTKFLYYISTGLGFAFMAFVKSMDHD